MGTNRKFFLLLLSVTVLLGAAIVFDLGTHATAIDQLKRILLDATESNPLDTLPFLAKRLLTILDMSSFLYGGISLFAVIMIVWVLRAAGDGELKALQSQVYNLTGRLSEADSARIETERSLNEELRYKSELLQENDSMVEEVEDSLRKIHTLTAQLRETQEILAATDTELKTRRSEVSDLTRHLTEAIAAKERLETSFREELANRVDGVQPNNPAHGELLETQSIRINVLERQLGETRELLIGKDRELSTLKSEVSDLTRQLTETVSVKEQSESALREELKQFGAALLAKDSYLRELNEHLNSTTLALKTRLEERESLLESHDTVLVTLKSELSALTRALTETVSAKEQSESALREKLEQLQNALQAKNATMKELENRLNTTTLALETQLSEREILLEKRDAALRTLSSEISDIARQFTGTGSDKSRTEILFLEETNDDQEQAGINGSTIKEPDESLAGVIHALKTELSERDSLLKIRDEQIEKLSQDIKESKSLFAAAESQVWQSLGRRNQWRAKLAKLRLHL